MSFINIPCSLDIPKRTVDQDSSSDVDKAIQSYKTDKSDKNYIEHRVYIHKY